MIAIRTGWMLLISLTLLGLHPAQGRAESEGTNEQVATEVPPTARQKPDSRGRARVRALAALAGLVLLGLALIAATWMGGRMTRRYMKAGDKAPVRPVDPIFTDDWASKPITPQEREKLDSAQW